MKSLIKIVLVLVVGILVYNYFFGTATERAQSERIFNDVKELGTSVKDLLVEEHQKYKEGKYDGLFDKLEGIYGDLENQWKDKGPELKGRLDSLQERRKDLEGRYGQNMDSTERVQIQRDLDELVDDTRRLLEKQKKGN